MWIHAAGHPSLRRLVGMLLADDRGPAPTRPSARPHIGTRHRPLAGLSLSAFSREIGSLGVAIAPHARPFIVSAHLHLVRRAHAAQAWRTCRR